MRVPERERLRAEPQDGLRVLTRRRADARHPELARVGRHPRHASPGAASAGSDAQARAPRRGQLARVPDPAREGQRRAVGTRPVDPHQLDGARGQRVELDGDHVLRCGTGPGGQRVPSSSWWQSVACSAADRRSPALAGAPPTGTRPRHALGPADHEPSTTEPRPGRQRHEVRVEDDDVAHLLAALASHHSPQGQGTGQGERPVHLPAFEVPVFRAGVETEHAPAARSAPRARSAPCAHVSRGRTVLVGQRQLLDVDRLPVDLDSTCPGRARMLRAASTLLIIRHRLAQLGKPALSDRSSIRHASHQHLEGSAAVRPREPDRQQDHAQPVAGRGHSGARSSRNRVTCSNTITASPSTSPRR